MCAVWLHPPPELIPSPHLSKVTKIELIQTIRKSENAVTLGMFYDEIGLPAHVREEDGSREQLLAVFGEIDSDGDKEITLDEFSGYLRRHRRKREENKVIG